MAERLQKLMAEAGLCSRRAAEALILAGRVTVNGAPAQLGQQAEADVDRIEVDGTELGGVPAYVYLMLNKPRGYVSTMSDEKGRPTVAQLVADCGTRVYPVGRLDMDSEGLLLLTNDGALTQQLLHPKFEREKEYLVTVAGRVGGAAARLSAIRALDGEEIRPARVSVVRSGQETATLSIIIHEGKNRQIRRMCAQAELYVKSLCRVREHTLTLGDLPAGKWRPLTAQELQEIK